MTTENKKITVRELQTFIEAVEFAADTDDWIPSERQWKRIRSMIDNLVEEAPANVKQTYADPYTLPTHRPAPVPAPDRPVTMAPGGLSGRAPAPAPSPALASNSPGIPVKTPDIDTSAGPYNSGFA